MLEMIRKSPGNTIVQLNTILLTDKERNRRMVLQSTVKFNLN